VTAIDALDAQGVIERLGLEYLPGEGVWVGLLWRNDSGNAIHGLLTRDDFSALHLLHEDELWLHVAGSSVDMLLLHEDGASATHRLGRGEGEEMSVLVPAGAWQGSRPDGDWALVACALAPPFSGFELADASTDLSAWPEAEAAARGLIRG
jgi:predicted cupin superfamily sugar epimerase